MSFAVGEGVRREPGGKQAVIVGEERCRTNPRLNAMPVFYINHNEQPRTSEWLTHNLKPDPEVSDELWVRYVAAVLNRTIRKVGEI